MRLTMNVVTGLALSCLAATMAISGCGERDDGTMEARTGAVKTLQLVCHVPPGQPGNAHELSVASAAVPAHLAHGDRLGPCVAPGPCTGQPDGSACSDGDLCTINDVCLGGACTPGAAVTCSDRGACQTAGACDPGTGICSYSPLADGTACDDNLPCTIHDACSAGLCVGKGPGYLEAGETKTFTCPSDAQAIDGFVQPTTCMFGDSFSPNNVFTGAVSLMSHLDRGFGGFDIFTIPDGSLQLGCVYRNADALQIGGTTGFTNATSCTPTETSFVCTR